MYEYDAEIVRWIDGDTGVLDIDLGFYVHVIAHVRLADGNAPEMITATGLMAWLQNKRILPVGSSVRIQTMKREGDVDKYGRWLAIILFKPVGETEYVRLVDNNRYISLVIS